MVRRWGWAIAVIGVALLTSGVQRGSALEIVLGGAVAIAGSAAWVTRRLHRIGWILAALGAGTLTVGYVGGSIFGIPVPPRNAPMLAVGALMVVAGGVIRGVLLAAHRRRIAQQEPDERFSAPPKPPA
jgi:hypothetical protein